MNKAFALSMLLAFTAGCSTMGTLTKVAGTLSGHPELISAGQGMERANKEFTEEEKYFTGRTVACQLLIDHPPSSNSGLEKYLGEVGQTVALSAPKPDQFKGWHFILIQGAAPEAFSCPGGFVLVSEGLVKACANEDQLACVLAHEAAHLAFNHPMQAISDVNRKAAFVGLAQFGVSMATKNSDLRNLTGVFSGAVKEVAKVVSVGYDHGKELEADKAAVSIAAQAGYNPLALADFLENLKATGSVHGSPKQRASEVRKAVTALGSAPLVAPERSARFAKAAGK
jgi:predicted Zn-dependent protease